MRTLCHRISAALLSRVVVARMKGANDRKKEGLTTLHVLETTKMHQAERVYRTGDTDERCKRNEIESCRHQVCLHASVVLREGRKAGLAG